MDYALEQLVRTELASGEQLLEDARRIHAMLRDAVSHAGSGDA